MIAPVGMIRPVSVIDTFAVAVFRTPSVVHGAELRCMPVNVVELPASLVVVVIALTRPSDPIIVNVTF